MRVGSPWGMSSSIVGFTGLLDLLPAMSLISFVT